jgi:Putative adhesin
MLNNHLIAPLNKRVAACALAVLVGPWPLAHAATSVDEHRPASPQGMVDIDNVAGSIDIQGWDKPEVAVTGNIGKDVDRVEVTNGADRTTIRVVLIRNHSWGSGRDASANLVIHVPSGSSIAATLVSSDLKVSSVHGDFKAQTVSGNISGEVGGDVRANAVSGDIHLIAGTAKAIEAKSISGDVVLTGGNADTEVTTVSGNAKLTLGTVPRARFRTVSGDFSANMTAAAGISVEAESISGNVNLDFASAPAADFDVQTLSGDIDNCFGPRPVRPQHGPGSRLMFKTGDGRVRITTKSGDVRLCAKGAHRD